MNNIEWLDSYIGISTIASPTSVPECTSKSTKKSEGPWFKKFPPIERLSVLRAQFWDNGPKPGKGKVQHTMKLRLYLDDGQPINQKEPHWQRVVELIEPKKVVAWATGEHAKTNITAADLARYQDVEAQLQDWMAEEPDSAWVKMGHIGSPPGTHYFPNQFVAVRCKSNGDMTLTLHIDGDEIEVGPFYENPSQTPKSSKRHALYDPFRRIPRRRPR